MNILINYDYMNAVKNVNEPFTPFKIIRNNKAKFAKYHLPIYLTLDLLIVGTDLKKIFRYLALQFGLAIAMEFIIYLAAGDDLLRVKSEVDLKELVRQFKDANVETSYDLVRKSKVYDKKYEVKINENKIPELIQSKYILVPTYDYLGDVKETSILQEHVMGSKDYVLSLGSPKKVLKPVFSNI